MKIKKFRLGELYSNSYVVYEDNRCFVVDPGYPNDKILPFIEKHNLIVEAIYITHGHFDHWGGAKDIKRQFPNAVIYAPVKDQLWFIKSPYNHYWQYTLRVDFWVQDGDLLPLLDRKWLVRETPGHSAGSTVLYFDKVLFTGDTLFFQAVGRTDIVESDFHDLKKSVKRLYTTFPDETVIYPGHGLETTIEKEKYDNPFISL